MPTTVMDPGQGALAQALGQLGAALGERAGRKRRREEAFQADPNATKVIATLPSRAKLAGPDAVKALADSFGIGEEFVQNAATGVLPGLEEQVSEDLTQRGMADILADNMLLEGALQADKLETLYTADGGRLAGLAELTDHELAISEGRVKTKYFTLFDAAGGMQVQVNAELGALENQIAQQGLTRNHLDAYRSWVNSLDQSDPEQRELAFMAAAYMTNPGFADYLAQREEADVRVQLAKIAQEPTLKDKLDLTVTVATQMATAFEDLRTLEEDGASQDAIDAQSAILDNWSAIFQGMQSGGYAFGSSTIGSMPEVGLFGGERGAEFFTQDPIFSPEQIASRTSALITEIESGRLNAEELSEEDLAFLNETEMSQFQQYLASREGTVEEEEPDPRSAIDKINVFLGGKEGMVDQARTSILEVLQNPELSGPEKREQIQILQRRIKAIQEQTSIGEFLRGLLVGPETIEAGEQAVRPYRGRRENQEAANREPSSRNVNAGQNRQNAITLLEERIRSLQEGSQASPEGVFSSDFESRTNEAIANASAYLSRLRAGGN